MDTKEILKSRLEELTEKKQDEDYTLTLTKQADGIKIPYQTFRKYLKGTAECPVSNLVKISEYYNVSTDYLLGLTSNPSIKEDIQQAHKTTNLSITAIEHIKLISDKILIYPLDCFLTSNHLINFLLQLYGYGEKILKYEQYQKEYIEKLESYNEYIYSDILRYASERIISDSNFMKLESAELLEYANAVDYDEYRVQGVLKLILKEYKEGIINNAKHNPKKE